MKTLLTTEEINTVDETIDPHMDVREGKIVFAHKLEQLLLSKIEGTMNTDNQRNPLDVQVAGDHYKSLGIQPVEYIHANNLDYFQGNVVKYVTRHKSKNGADDLRKAIHYCQLALKLQYGVDS